MRSDAALAAKQDQATPRVRAANANPALWDPNHADHDKARKELREAVAQDVTDEERDALASEPVAMLRSRFSIEDPRTKIPHPVLRERWDSEAKAVGLASMANWGVDALCLRPPRGGRRRGAGARRGLRLDSPAAVLNRGAHAADRVCSRAHCRRVSRAAGGLGTGSPKGRSAFDRDRSRQTQSRLDRVLGPAGRARLRRRAEHRHRASIC